MSMFHIYGLSDVKYSKRNFMFKVSFKSQFYLGYFNFFTRLLNTYTQEIFFDKQYLYRNCGWPNKN